MNRADAAWRAELRTVTLADLMVSAVEVRRRSRSKSACSGCRRRSAGCREVLAMKVFMTGATGVIGPPTVDRLVEAGHEVRGRLAAGGGGGAAAGAGAEPVAVDLFDADAVKAAVAGSDAIVHVATNVPPFPQMMRASAWGTHNRLRTEATRHLVDAAKAHGIGRMVKESITFIYDDGGDAWLDESSPLTPTPGLMAPTVEGENTALELPTPAATACCGSGSSTAAPTGAPTRC